MNQIDPEEARYWLATEEQKQFMRARGYVRGLQVAAPSVVGLNAALAACAVNEFSVYISGLRPVQALCELDLLGAGRATKAQWLTPIRVIHKAGCPACEVAGGGDAANVGRYQLLE
ncbi:MAG: hypothetical protein HYS35_01350 [Betaproteobacteria bacterium]|nr:hypothetical protein [Betaproteobacteria bacterium]